MLTSARERRESPAPIPDVLPARHLPSTPGLGCGGGRRLVGFSAFPDGGRFEALSRTGPGDEKPAAGQEQNNWLSHSWWIFVFLLFPPT